MAKNRNQNRDRSSAPSRSADSGQPAATMEPREQSSSTAGMNSGMNQETSRKRKKKFGHN